MKLTQKYLPLLLVVLLSLSVFAGCTQQAASQSANTPDATEKANSELNPVSSDASTADGLPQFISQVDWVGAKQEIALSTGIHMKYVEMGQADGETVILLHGMTDNSRSWSLLAPMLTDNYHIYMLDQRGHGDTDKPDARMYTTAHYASDVAAFMEAMQIDSAHIVGHSLGSMIAQTFAVNYPEKTGKLALVAAAPVEFASLGRDIYDAVLAFGQNAPDDEFMAAWYENPNPINEEFLRYEMKESQNIPIFAWRAITKSCALSDLTPFMDELMAPTVIFWGEIDGFFGQSVQDRLCELIPHAEFISYPEIGHNIQWEHTAQMGNDLLEFLQK